MKTSHSQGTIALAVMLLGFGVTGCAASAPDQASGSGGTTATAPSEPSETVEAEPEPEPAPDLTGEWKQTNSNAEDSYQVATITADTIEVLWITDGGDTRSLYWAGTFVPPTEAGSFTWDSVNDTAQTAPSMMASGDPTKTFSHEDGEISYDVSLMGTTMTVRLGRE